MNLSPAAALSQFFLRLHLFTHSADSPRTENPLSPGTSAEERERVRGLHSDNLLNRSPRAQIISLDIGNPFARYFQWSSGMKAKTLLFLM